MSGTEAAAAEVAVAAVPDMICNILERVDLVSLFGCSLVCKHWRGLVSDPAFLRRHDMASASLVGIFVQRDRPRKITKLFPTIAPALVPAPGSVLRPQLRSLTSFVHDDDGILDDVTPLAARDGLLLVRVWRPRTSTDNAGGRVLVLRLCVCNLLTGKRDLLPAFDVDAAFDAHGVKGYALLTAADHGPHNSRCPADGYSTLFQVFLVGRGNPKQVHVSHGYAGQLQIRRFSSASGDRDALDVQGSYGLWGPYGERNIAVVARGTAHWLFSRHGRSITLDVNASTGQVSITALSGDAVAAFVRAVRPYKPQWLCTTAEGRLARLCMETNNRLVMMKQRVDGWDSSHVAQVHVDVELGFGRASLSPVCFGDRSGTALAVSPADPERRVYVLDIDLQTFAVSAIKVEGWIWNFNYMTAAPFEINCAMFFVSCLGVNKLSS